MLELYHTGFSTCSQRVRMALHEKGLPWVDHPVSLEKGEHQTPEFLKINPNGLVPTLVHDGRAIPDSSVILEYLEDVFPDKPLRPTDFYEISRMRAWVQYIDEVPTPAVRYPSFHMIFGREMRKLTPEQMASVAAAKPLRKHFMLKFGPQGFPQELLDQANEQIDQSFGRMESALTRGPWLLGEMFSIADISIMPTVVRMHDLHLHRFFDQRPQVVDWFARIQQRASFVLAYFPGSRVSLPPSG